MKHSYFDIKNFKGINHIRLDFSVHPKSNIYTLIGLNESGKTTILEALHFLTYTTETVSHLELPGYPSIKDVHESIPINKRSNFNESIIIEAGYIIEHDDEQHIGAYLKDKMDFNLTSTIDSLVIKQSYKFHNSEVDEKQPTNQWIINFKGKKKKARKEITLKGTEWAKAINHVYTLLPRVIYFPNFLFEFPDRIYLDDPPSDKEKHEYYREILQDVLDSIGEETNLKDHVLARAKDDTPHVKRALDSVLLKMGSSISSTVFRNWNRIFNRPSNGKQVVVDCEKDVNGLWFIKIQIRDTDEIYEISERSLGFRWFFAFLLLTQYRESRGNLRNNILFLFDEPASNLHSSAQSQLLCHRTLFSAK